MASAGGGGPRSERREESCTGRGDRQEVPRFVNSRGSYRILSWGGGGGGGTPKFGVDAEGVL